MENSLRVLDECEKVLKENPNNLNRLYQRANALSTLGNWILSLNDFLLLKDIYEKNPSEKNKVILAEIYSRIGSTFSIYNQTDRSIHYRMLAIKTDPKETRHLYNLGGYLSLSQRNFREGIYYLKEVLKVYPKHNFANWGLGAAYLELEQYDLALKYVDLAFDNEAFLYKYGTAKSENDIRVVRGFAYHKLGKSDLAIADLNEAIRINSKNSIAHAYLGIVYSDLGDKQKACEYFEKAQELGFDRKFPDKKIESLYQKVCNNKENLEISPIVSPKDLPYIAPNPAVDFVEVYNFPYSDFDYFIYNIDSQTVAKGISGGKKIAVGNLPTGLYLLTVSKGGKVETFRLLKN